MQVPAKVAAHLLAAAVLLASFGGEIDARKRKDKKRAGPAEDPYAEYVWPPPPDEPRIKLESVIAGRGDVVAKSRFRKKLLGFSPQSPYDQLKKPFGVAFDDQGRILVTDSANGALIRFDREGRRMDVLGTGGRIRLKMPMGLDVGTDGAIYVADAVLRQVLAIDAEGKILAVYGRTGDLANPTDVAVSPDGSRLFVTDSKAHKIVVFDRTGGDVVDSFGVRGAGDGEFSFPTSLCFGAEGELFVVDQINSRVQVFDGDGEYLDQFGSLGVGFANFVRPKDVAVDRSGLIYVTDNAFNNLQLFDADFTLLTFIGEGGHGPGRFHGASGVAVRGDEFAVVDQLGRRVQVFRFIKPRQE